MNFVASPLEFGGLAAFFSGLCRFVVHELGGLAALVSRPRRFFGGLCRFVLHELGGLAA